jgi:flagellar biosynthetic protein FliP
MTFMARLLPLLIAVLALILPDVAHAAGAAKGAVIDLSNVTMGDDTTLSGRVIQLIAILTVLSIAPGILVMMTSFTRLVIVFSLLRSAMGLNGSPPNMVVVSLSLFLTAYIMAPTMDKAWNDGLHPLLNNEITEEQAFDRISTPFKNFMLANTRDKDLSLFIELGKDPDSKLAKKDAKENKDAKSEAVSKQQREEVGLRTLIPAFMISEIRRAFEIGFLLFLPFLIIDMIVASALMSMGMMMLPPVMISLPFKIIFFVLVDGWYLLAGSLVRSYGAG